MRSVTLSALCTAALLAGPVPCAALAQPAVHTEPASGPARQPDDAAAVHAAAGEEEAAEIEVALPVASSQTQPSPTVPASPQPPAVEAPASRASSEDGAPTATLEVRCELPVGQVLVAGGRVATLCPGTASVQLAGRTRAPVAVLLGRRLMGQTQVALADGHVTVVRVLNEGGTPRVHHAPPRPRAAQDAMGAPLAELAEQPGLMEQGKPRDPSSSRPWWAPGPTIVMTVGVLCVGSGLALLAGGITQAVVGLKPPPAPTQTLPGFLSPVSGALVAGAPVLIAAGLFVLAGGVALILLGLLFKEKDPPAG